MKPVLAIGLLATLAGCATAPQPRYEIISAYHARSGSGESPDDRLRAVAFQRLEGMSRARALAYLEADGFQCRGVTCVNSIREKLNARDETFALSTPDTGSLTKRRAYMQSYSLSLVAERIEDPEHIYADAIFHSGMVPRYRSAYPTDLEVTDD